MLRTVITVLAISLAGGAFAHGGVQNPAVKERMALMEEIKDATGVLIGMARGKIGFDAAQAEKARVALHSAAKRTPALFKAEETDPKSEALPAIWTDWEDFAAKAALLTAASAALDTSSLDTVRSGVGAVGQACQACHEGYRIKK